MKRVLLSAIVYEQEGKYVADLASNPSLTTLEAMQSLLLCLGVIGDYSTQMNENLSEKIQRAEQEQKNNPDPTYGGRVVTPRRTDD